MRFLVKGLVASLCASATALAVAGKPNDILLHGERALQDIVTWDEHSFFVRGERVLLLSGEFHPFRLPVPDLWLDVFQKIKSLGFNGVSFYTDWALHEGQPGKFRADGVFDLQPFFDAASKAGIYLLARPGPYINAEVSGGGFPGWLQRVPGQLRTPAPTYLNATQNYVSSISAIIKNAQITNGGPVILFQPENEYTQAVPGIQFPNRRYFQYVVNQFRNAGIVVPFISNDASPKGIFANTSLIDVYGHDGYPLGFDCANPTSWGDDSLPTNWHQLHEEQAPSTPYSIVEFQGGSFDPWGGSGFAKCLQLINQEFLRVFWKNNYAAGVTFFNTYMIFGGTNWGNLGHPGGYVSYDYAASIAEDRTVSREKYSEAKLQANFLMASPDYLTITPSDASTNYTTSGDITTTPLLGNGTSFFVVRHTAYNTFSSTSYQFKMPTTKGTVTVPQLAGQLSLNGRDTKWHVSNYKVGARTLLYSTAEIFTWKSAAGRTVLVVYGGPGEQHELAFLNSPAATQVAGTGVQIGVKNGSRVLNWQTTTERRVVKVANDLFIHIVDRNAAYNYWTLPAGSGSVVANAGYLLRSAALLGSTLALTGDANATMPLEILSAPVVNSQIKTLTFNGQNLAFKTDAATGNLVSSITFNAPQFSVPDLSKASWQYIDTLPEIAQGYDDTKWTNADLKKTYNTYTKQTTPTSLFSSDYGYHTGVLLYRGHFTSTGAERTLKLATQGGSAFGHSVWLDSVFIGSWEGSGSNSNYTSNFNIPSSAIKKGSKQALTVVIDNLGLDENYNAGDSGMKNPRGILDYQLDGHNASDVSWKLTGNLGGEAYQDLSRGPFNEGGLFFERQGFHLPGAPTQGWQQLSPSQGLSKAGVGFFTTNLNLNFPKGYDIPLSFVFQNVTSGAKNFRVQLYVNGWQYGKYVNNVGPQTSFPVPEGILQPRGSNYVGIALWAQETDGAKVNVSLQPTATIQTGYGAIGMAPGSAYSKRAGAY